MPMRRLLLVLLTAVLGACGSEATDALPATAPDEDPGLVHIHGLGVNPADDRVYVATHFGLWRIDGPGDVRRVGDYFYDLMGFTVVGEDHFLASGHPLLTDDLPPLLGLIESTDGGVTWRSVSLFGSVDFHALRAEHDLVYGWNSTDGAFMVSPDGEEWERRGTHESVLDFVVDPDDPDHLLALADDRRLGDHTDRAAVPALTGPARNGGEDSPPYGGVDPPHLRPSRHLSATSLVVIGEPIATAVVDHVRQQIPPRVDRDFADRRDAVAGTAESLEATALLRSRDGGRTWTRVDDAPPIVRLTWTRRDRLWGVGIDGSVWQSTDGSGTWTASGQAAGRPEAMLDTGAALIVAGGGAIAESADGGQTWDEVLRTDAHP